MIKKIIIWFLLSIFSYAILSYIPMFLPRSIGGHSFKILLSLVLVPILLYVFKNDSFKIKTLKAITFCFSVIFLTFVAILTNPEAFSLYLVSHMSTLFVLLSIVISYIISVNNNRLTNFIIILFFISLTFWSYFVGINLWINKVNFKSFSGFQNETLSSTNNFNVYFIKDTDSINLANVKDTVIVVDCWTSSCGACFKQFPKFEKIMLEFKSTPNIKFIALNTLQREEIPSEVYKLVGDEYSSFNVGFISKKQAESIGVNVYPTYLIIKNNQILYKGSSYNLKKGIRQALSK